MARNKLGPIPDDHFENEPTYPPKNVTPLTEKEIEWLERLKVLVSRLNDHGMDKYRPNDIVGGY